MNAAVAHFGWELRKIFRGRQAWLGFIGAVAFEAVFFALLKLPSVRPALEEFFLRFGYSFSDGLSGLTLAVNVIGYAVFVLTIIFVALVAGESISRDVDTGALRLVLCRPVSRAQVWAVKLLACTAYTVAIVAVAALAALAMGLAVEGWGPIVVHITTTGSRVAYAAGDGLLLYLLAIPFLVLSFFTVTVIAFSLSCAGVRGATASIATISWLLGEELLRQMPFLASVRPYFLMSYVEGWSRVFESRPGWGWVWEVYAPLAAFDALALGAGLFVFLRRDLKP